MDFDYTLRNQSQLKINGPVVALVTSLEDPDKLGRIKVKFPWLSDEIESGWARVAVPFAGADRGIQFLPEIGDEVLVFFQMGNVQSPVVMGSLWSSVDTPPSDAQDGKNHLKVIKTTANHKIEFSDNADDSYILITDGKEKNSIKLNLKDEGIEITSAKKIMISSENGEIILKADKIKMEASSGAEISSNAGVDIKASGTMNLSGSTINLN